MLSDEKEFKREMINKLNAINSGWIDGDRDTKRHRKADVVNHLLKIVIEIKDDRHYKIEVPNSGEMVSSGEDLNKMNQRFTDHLRSANNKFKEYPDCKTILLIRTEFPIIDIIRYSIEGLHTYKLPPSGKRPLIYNGRKTKYSEYIRKEIGCYLISNQENYYFSNKFANQERVLKKEKVEKMFDLKLKDIPQI